MNPNKSKKLLTSNFYTLKSKTTKNNNNQPKIKLIYNNNNINKNLLNNFYKKYVKITSKNKKNNFKNTIKLVLKKYKEITGNKQNFKIFLNFYLTHNFNKNETIDNIIDYFVEQNFQNALSKLREEQKIKEEEKKVKEEEQKIKQKNSINNKRLQKIIDIIEKHDIDLIKNVCKKYIKYENIENFNLKNRLNVIKIIELFLNI